MKYTLESCKLSSKQYNTKKEWRENDKNCYHNAWLNGWLDICTSHMVNPYSAPTDEECILSAKYYVHKYLWMRACTREYSKAKKNNDLYIKCTSHMVPAGNLKLRLIYMFYVGTVCYIGLSGTLEKRMNQHKSTQRYIELSKLGNVELVILQDLCDIETAVKKETEYITYYSNLGWTILNKSNGGELGGRKVSSKSDIINQALQYSTVKEWRNCGKSLYSTASKLGILDECCKHMKPIVTRWSIAELKKEALKYDTLKDWRDTSKSSYASAYKRNIISECSTHMILFQHPKNYWNSYDKCLTEALKYKNTQEWKKYGKGSYFSAYKNDWWKIISSKIKQTNGKNRVS